MKRRRTRQLTAIWDVLAGSSDHPTAEQVLERVRRDLPRVSLGTIYRNLEKLRSLGQVKVVHLAGGIARYDALDHPHDHFVCEQCDVVLDLEPCGDRVVDLSGLKQDGFLVRSQSVAVYGLCRSCARRRTVSAPLSAAPAAHAR